MAGSRSAELEPRNGRRRSRVASLGLTAVLASSLLGSCGMVGQIVEYTDGLRNSQEHTIVVRGVSQIGAFLGLLASVPVTLASVPFTYPSYLVYDSIEPDEAFVVDMLLLPSFTLLEIGSLLGAPADLIERLVYKAWVPPDSMTEAEQEAFENDLDEDTLPRYPVTPILPLPRR